MILESTLGPDLFRAVTFYASFDKTLRGDFGCGGLELGTRYGPPAEPDKHRFEPGIPDGVYRIAPGRGVSGGALEATRTLPDSGRIYFPAAGNLAVRPGGWSGAVSLWVDTDPNELIRTTFCDPIQLTQNGANNGGLWIDFDNSQPRALRHGAFPAAAPGQPPLREDAPDAPLVRVPAVPWKAGEWHHVAFSWSHLDTGRPDAVSSLFVDGRRLGAIENRPIAMNWNPERTGIYLAVNFVGFLDELILFDRELSPDEIARLRSVGI